MRLPPFGESNRTGPHIPACNATDSAEAGGLIPKGGQPKPIRFAPYFFSESDFELKVFLSDFDYWGELSEDSFEMLCEKGMHSMGVTFQ